MPILNSNSLHMMTQVVLLVITAAAHAAVVSDTAAIPGNPGVPVHQRFLPNGASVVRTLDARSCIVSQRLEIENSVYRDPQGNDIAFDRIIRSPAASLQAISTEQGEVSFRLQLKYSIATGIPILLMIGDTELDVQSYLEKSTDSLLLNDEAATLLETAFRDGVVPVLSSVSMDTDHLVVDQIPAPDLAALNECIRDEQSEPEPTVQIDNSVRLTFHADRETTPLATLPQLRACRMKDEPGELHLATLDEVGGFFSQTNKIFVSFQEDGSLARAYIPGVFDADFSQSIQTARLSLAADSNVPSAPNDVKGCLGAAEIRICSYAAEDGQYRIGPCLDDDALAMFPDATGFIPDFALPGSPASGVSPRRVTLPRPGTGFSNFSAFNSSLGPLIGRPPTGGTFTPGRPVIPKVDDPVKVPDKVPEMPLVPLPLSLMSMLAAVASLLVLRRRATS